VVAAGILLSLVFWVFGQSLGGYFSGLATDPSSGPLFILLGVAILSCQSYDVKTLWRKSFRNLEQFLT
jgi:hypothetical protein